MRQPPPAGTVADIEPLNPEVLPVEPTRGVVAVIEDQGRLLVIRRAEGIRAGGSWCFPGGAIEAGETPAEAVIREMREELGAQVMPLQEVWEWRRQDGWLVLSWWRAELVDAGAVLRPDPAEVAEFRWARPDEIRRLQPSLPSNEAFLDRFYPVQD